MSTRTHARRRSSIRLALALCLLLPLALSACGSSTTVVFVPSQVLAQFAVFQHTTNSLAGPTTTNYAGAIFWKGWTTQAVTGGSVSVVDPVGVEHVMPVVTNPAGAPYYLTPLTSVTLGGVYVFRVTLEDGTRLETSVTAPAQSLQVFSPQLGATLALNDYLDVEWTGGSTPATRHVSIVLRRESTAEIFSVLGLGKIQVPDTGALDGQNPPPPYVTPILVMNARETGDVGTGTRYLTVTRNNTVSAGGFYAGSFAQASLIFGQEVEITP